MKKIIVIFVLIMVTTVFAAKSIKLTIDQRVSALEQKVSELEATVETLTVQQRYVIEQSSWTAQFCDKQCTINGDVKARLERLERKP